MKITICIGSSCHLKGSRYVLEQLQTLIAEHNLKDKVTIAGTFCLGICQEHVSVCIDDQVHSVTPESTKEFFEKEVLAKL